MLIVISQISYPFSFDRGQLKKNILRQKFIVKHRDYSRNFY